MFFKLRFIPFNFLILGCLCWGSFSFATDPIEMTALSIDGGGIRGYIPALWLQYMQNRIDERKKVQAELAHINHVSDLFDCVGGTSIGGILALGLSSPAEGELNQPRFQTHELVNFFKEERFRVFRAGPMRKILTGNAFLKSLYDPGTFEGLLAEKFQETKLSDSRKEIAVVSSKFKDKSLYVFSKDSEDFYMRDVARATSAAPSYFTPAAIQPIDNEDDEIDWRFIDGGICVNNPSQIILNRLMKKHSLSPDKIFMVSFGTGKCTPSSTPSLDGGLLSWAKPVSDYYMTGNSEAVADEVALLLQGNYHRVQPEIQESIDLADVDQKNLDLLQNYAVQEHILNQVEHLTDQLIEIKMRHNLNRASGLQEILVD